MGRGPAYRRATTERTSLRAVRSPLSMRGRGRIPARDIDKRAATLRLCSCWLRDNQRRYFGTRTLREQRARLTVE